MRKIIFSAVIICGLYSCALETQNNTAESRKLEDTLFKAFPTVNRLSIEIEEGWAKSKISITMGDADLFNTTEEARMEVARKTGDITLHVFDQKKWPDEGEVIFVKEETTLTGEDAEKKTYDMHLEELKKDQTKK